MTPQIKNIKTFHLFETTQKKSQSHRLASIVVFDSLIYFFGCFKTVECLDRLMFLFCGVIQTKKRKTPFRLAADSEFDTTNLFWCTF